MSHAHRALVLLAALVSTCAQGCRVGVPRAAQLMQESPSASAPPAPTPHAPPFPAFQRGTEAFAPFVKLSSGRAFESREVRGKPARRDLKVSADYPVLVGDDRPAAREFNRRARSLVMDEVPPYLEDTPDPEKAKYPLFIFEEYQAVSYADGEPKVLISFDSLKEFINPRGALAKLAA